MALIVLDASVFIAYRTRADAHHPRAVAALRSHERDEVLLPASAYAEVLVEPSRKGPDVVKRAVSFIHDFPIRVVAIDAAIAERAALLREHLRLPDALVIATAETLKAERILTTDRAWRRVSRLVRVI